MALNDLPKHIREPLLEISVKTSSGILLDPLDLFNRLRSSQITNESFKSLVVSQYEIALRRRNYEWVDKAKNLIEIFRNYLSIWANRTLITPESKRQNSQEVSRTYHSDSSPVSTVSKFQAHQETLDMVDNRRNYNNYYGPDYDNRLEGRNYISYEDVMNNSSIERISGNDKRESSYGFTNETSDSAHQQDSGLFSQKDTGKKFVQNQPTNSSFQTLQGRSRQWTSQKITTQDQLLSRQGVQWGQGVGFDHDRLSNTGMSNQSTQIVYSSHNMIDRKSVSHSLQYPMSMSQSISSSIGRNYESNEAGFATRQGTIIGNQAIRNDLHNEVTIGNMGNDIMLDQTPVNQITHDGIGKDPYVCIKVGQDKRLPSDRLPHKNSANSNRDEEYGQIHKRMRRDYDCQEDIHDYRDVQTSRSTNMIKDTSRSHKEGIGDWGRRGTVEDDIYDYFYGGEKVSRGYEEIKDTKRQVRKLQKSPERRRKSDRPIFGDERGKLKVQKHFDGASRSKEPVKHAPLQQPDPSDDDFYIDWLESSEQEIRQRSRTRSKLDNEGNETSSLVEDRNEDMSDMHQIQNSLTDLLSKDFVQMQEHARSTIQLQDNNYHGSAFGLKDKILSCPPNEDGTIITEQELMKRSYNDTISAPNPQPAMMQIPMVVPGMIVRRLRPMAMPLNQLPCQSEFKQMNRPTQVDIVNQGLQIMPLPADELAIQSGLQHMDKPLELEPVLLPDNHNRLQSGFQPMSESFNKQSNSLSIRENIGNTRGKNDRKRKSTEMMSNKRESPRHTRDKYDMEKHEVQIIESKRSWRSRSEQSSFKSNERSTRGNERLNRAKERLGRGNNQGKSIEDLRNIIPKQLGQFNVGCESFGQFGVIAKKISKDNIKGHGNIISEANDTNIKSSDKSYRNLYMNSNKRVNDKNKSSVQVNSNEPKASLHQSNNLQSTLIEHDKRNTTSVKKTSDNGEVLWIIDGKAVPISRRAARRKKAAMKKKQLERQKSLQNSEPPSSKTNQMFRSQTFQGIKQSNTIGLHTTAPEGQFATAPGEPCTTPPKRISTIASKGSSAIDPKAANTAVNTTDAIRKQQERNTIKSMMTKESIKPNQNLDTRKERPNISVTQENISVSVTGKKARKKKHCTCSVCGKFIPIPRMHFMKVHLPLPFISFQTACPQEVDNERAMVLSQSLEYLKILILGSEGTLSELTGELNAKKLINYSEKYVHPKYRRPMTQFCNFQKWTIPEFFSINPLNTNAGLLHWRALEGCYKFLDRKTVNDFIAYSNKLSKMQGNPEQSKLFCVIPSPIAKHMNEDKNNQGTNKTSKTDKTSKANQTDSAATIKSSIKSQSNQGSKCMETKKAPNENQKSVVHNTGETLQIELPQNVHPGKKADEGSSKKNVPNNEKKETVKTSIGKLMVKVDVELAPSKPSKKSIDNNITSQPHERYHAGEVQIHEHDDEEVDIDLEGDFIVLEEVSEYSEQRYEDKDDTCSNNMGELFVVVEEVNDEDAQHEVNDTNNTNIPHEKATEDSAEVIDAVKNAHDRDTVQEKNNTDNTDIQNEAVTTTSKSVVVMSVPKVPYEGSDIKTGEVGKISKRTETVRKISNSDMDSKQKSKALNIVAQDSETNIIRVKDKKESNSKPSKNIDKEMITICEVIVENEETEPSEMIVESNANAKKNIGKGTPKQSALRTAKTVKPKDSSLTLKSNPSSQVSKGLTVYSISTQKTNLDARGNFEELEKVFNVYLDPSTYPTNIPYSKIKSSVGVGAQWASQFMDHLELFENLIRNKSVIALGPVGLDFTQPVYTWQDQEEVFKAALDYCSVKKVLILNLQGGDESGVSSCSKGLDIVSENCGSKQPVLLRNFSGTNEDALSWSSQFKNCYFELNPNENTLRDVLKSIPDTRIILNMDKVKIEPGVRTDAISDVILMSLGKDDSITANKTLANIIANELQICIDEVITKCYENKCRLFSFAV